MAMRSIAPAVAVAAACVAAGVPAASSAQRTGEAAGFPSRPIRIVVPFTPGGQPDIFSRMIGQKASEISGGKAQRIPPVGGFHRYVRRGLSMGQTRLIGEEVLMAEMYSNPAAYEAMMGRWSARLAPLFVEFARVRDGDSVLDVGYGTGSLVQAVTDKTRRSKVVGIDPVEPFIEYARSRFADARISFDRGSAFELPYEDAHFDACLSLLVLMLIPTPEKAAREMARVTRPGGTVAACTWDAGGATSGTLWEEAIRLDPAAQVERPKHCNRKGQLAELWQTTGLKDVEETLLEIETKFSSFDDYWSPFLAGVGPPGIYVAGLPADRRKALREALRKRHLGGQSDGAFSITARAWAVRGTVPT